MTIRPADLLVTTWRLSTACMVAVASTATAQPDTPAAPPVVADSDAADPAVDLAARLTALNDPDYATRAAATDALLRDDRLSLGDLAAAANAAEPLPPETRERLLYVARHHTVRGLRNRLFPAEGRGSIGIVQAVQSDPLPPENAEPAPRGRAAVPQRTGPPYALVTGVLPGFPACGRLRPQDRIVALDGQPLDGPSNPTTFQSMLAPLEAGHTIILTVVRDGETLRVPLILANRAALAGLYVPPNHSLHPRFAAEWAAERKPFDWPADGVTPGVTDPDAGADPVP